VVKETEKAEDLLARGEQADVVVFGHTHEVALERRGEVLWVNPGECGGWLTGHSQVAILDTNTLDVEFIDLGQTER